ncbi:MAG: hypothetical protein ACXWPM_06120 [Bdellovibrionota bacterium]
MATAAATDSSDACFCKQFEDRIATHTLASDVSDVGAAALHPEGHALQSQKYGDSPYRLKISADELIPERCRSYLVSKRSAFRPSFVFRGVVGGDAPAFTTGGTDAERLAGIHDGAYAYYNLCPRPATDADQPVYAACMKKNGDLQLQKYSGDIYSGSIEEEMRKLNALGYKNLTMSEAKILKAYNQLLLMGRDEKQIISNFEAHKDGLNEAEFVSLEKLLGYRLHQDYDHVRLAKWTTAQGGIDGNRLLSSARTNVSLGVGGSLAATDPMAPYADFEGVCRDIASFQAKIARAHGWQNSFVVGFQKTDGVMHATFLTEPTNSKTIYQFNYSTTSTRTGVEGGSALFQGSLDYTTNYRVFAPDGGMVADVPSEMGKFLHEAAGGNARDLDEGARVTGSLMAANISLGKGGQYQLRAVAGRDAQGAIYSGVAGDVRWGDQKAAGILPGRAGLFIGDQYRPATNFGTATGTNMLTIYVQGEQHLKTPDLPLAKGLKLTLDSSLLVTGAAGYAVDGPSQGKISAQGDAIIKTEVKLDYRGLQDQLHVTGRVGAKFSPSLLDVRNDQSVGLAFDQAYFDATATLRVQDVTFLANALAVVDQTGARGRLEVGAATRNLAGTAVISGKLTGETPLIQDGTTPRAGFNLNWRANQHVIIGASVDVPLDGGDVANRTEVMAHLNIVGN